jgi:hypothetical protein
LSGDTSVSKSSMPTTCAERANSMHVTLEDGSWRSNTLSNSQRTEDLYKWHHNLPQSKSEGMCSYSVSTTTKFSLNKILGVAEITLAGFHIFQHGTKGAVYHDCTTAPFQVYQKISDNRHESSRDSCMNGRASF